MPTLEQPSVQTENQTNLINPVLYYHPDGYQTSGQRLMGRQAAGESFLKAYCRYTHFETLTCLAPDAKAAASFDQQIRSYSDNQKNSQWVPINQLEQLQASGCLYLPGPGLAPYAWQRRHFNQRGFSLCGITHTTASDRIMDSLGAFLTAPVQPWDVLICTSHSVQAMVQTLLDNYQDYLSNRFGAPVPPCPIQLPVIPLGVDAEALKPTEQKRQMGKLLRQKLGLTDDTVAFLFMGRLSFHAKAHPYPMFVGLEKAAQQTGKKLCLILSGWFPNEHIQTEFQKAAQLLCPSVRLIIVDGRVPEVRQTIWYAADVFTSLSDNIQETFGLTPIEAKAAGLPVVVSDWDGYRETVNHGQDGLLIPTAMPAPGYGEDFALDYATEADTYDHYIGKVSQTIAVDVDACANAYVALIENPTLRQQMGKAGQQDVETRFDWPVVISQYQTLWKQLEQLRKELPEIAPKQTNQPSNPLRDDPYRLFASYPSQVLDPETHVKLTNPSQLDIAMSLSMNRLALQTLCSQAEMRRLLNALMQTDMMTLHDLAQRLPDLDEARFYRTIGWLGKMGILQTL